MAVAPDDVCMTCGERLDHWRHATCHEFKPWPNAARSPVVPAATDEPALAPDGRPASMFRPTDFSMDNDADEVTYFVSAPAATDEPALAVIREAIDDKRAHWSATFGYDRNAVARAVVAALEANGYVVLSREELGDLIAALEPFRNVPTIGKPLRAVVAAVGPTREDTKA